MSTTSYALLGLLAFDDVTSDTAMTGYELKQRSDYTLRFYWASPAMSQIYTELGRLDHLGMVAPVEARTGRRTSRRYRITNDGRTELTRWLHESVPDFPTLKHPVALRLLMGNLLGAGEARDMLSAYANQLHERRAELQGVRDMLGDSHEVRFAAMVADWGLAYYDSEMTTAGKLVGRLEKEEPDRPHEAE